jgi:antitoxin component of MazEF toxin-antitoxin module
MPNERSNRREPALGSWWTQRVRKVGNRLVLTIPREAVEALHLAPGQYVSFDLVPLGSPLQPAVQAALDSSWEEHADIYRELGRS